jgi:integrase
MILALTAARSGEARLAVWGEIDLASRTAERMKESKEHRIPLTNVAIALLGDPRGKDTLVFESDAKPGRPISDMTMTAVLKRMGRRNITFHGFHSTFRDWAGEPTGFPREVIEATLAHGIKDKAEATYVRSDLFDKRCGLMEA